ncbi:putative mitochondrial protein [Cucumis melo var. makuwa]|uniref:Mitochondrial protein n=1 Tax=Cucumis melo var. makuwa TaxID=1194695 RepID=A0A5D3DLB3_CUCMM|nr:putative mitochondrial protein [Cucumis melo var. makuwa]TYK24423.1 putative mitochondrial protein [Cucumis melo var. makuwa]
MFSWLLSLQNPCALGLPFISCDEPEFARIRRSTQTSLGIILLLSYVHDMIIISDNPQAISDLQCSLGKHFEMKDSETLNYFLGLEILSLSNNYCLSQARYASDLLTRSSITDSAISLTPLDPNVRLTPFDGVPLDDPTMYRQLVGILIYLTVTSLDIAHAIHIIGILGHGLQFSSQSSIILFGFSNADRTGDPIDRRSTTDYCFYLGDALIFRCNTTQTIVFCSGIRYEYRALANATSKLLWLR